MLLVYKNHKKYPFKKIFQIRWKEPMGLPECPYLYRWTLILFGYTIRIHHWLRSDDNRHFHDHSCDLISIILKGHYFNITPVDPDYPDVNHYNRRKAKAWKPWKAKATDKHYLEFLKVVRGLYYYKVDHTTNGGFMYKIKKQENTLNGDH